ncbi:PMR5 N-terminal domain [Macleaya cordata]|uniref:PMR5 N-terminal domain n=1 Tax=Macleaya cordata TaxID=56857 RepID=A0A200QCW6_MACCD|nr:PMR5 N-terminal domain [Macleaya cordata]
MKGGGIYGLRGKQISLTLIALIGTTIFIWAWEKSPLLTTFLPPQNRLLVPSPEILSGTPVVGVNRDISSREAISYAVPEGETTEQAEKTSNVATSTGAATKSTPEPDISSNEDISYTVPEGEARTEQAEKSSGVVTPIGSAMESTSQKSIDDGSKSSSSTEKEEGEKITEQAEKNSDVVTPIGSATKSTPETSIDDGTQTASSIEKKEIVMVVPQSETKPKEDPVEETRPVLADKISDVVTPVISALPTTSEEGKDVPQSETKPKKDPGEEKRPDLAEKSFDVVTPVSSANLSTFEEGKDDNSAAALVKKKEACNFAKGKWVEDSTRPLYSGFGCKQWLSDMWACRLTQRTDFSYERFRWKPYNCEMPDFEGSSFLRRMQDKTIAIVGDSLGRQQFQSLMCMVTGGKQRSDVVNVGWEYGLVKARGAIRPDGWAYRFPNTNTTILYYWSASLCDLEPINPTDRATDWAMHLDRPPAFLRRYLHRFDVLVLNTGHHWNRGKLNANRWVMHIGGVPNTDRRLAEIGRAKNFTIYSVVNWVNLQLPTHPRLKAFFRTISPRHFFNGDWNTGGSCDNTTPLAGGKEVTQDESLDPSASRAVMGTGVKLLDITALSQLRDEGHISRYSIKATPGMQDCLHWCLPGIPDTWNELLIAQL